MKAIFFSMMLLIFSATSFSQQANSFLSIPDNDYLQKSKKQKKAATIILCSGASISLIGLVISKKGYVPADNSSLFGISIATNGSTYSNVSDKKH